MVANLVRPGDRVVCGVHGLFGERMADALGRQGAEVVRVEAEWGRAIPVERLIEAAGPGLDAMFVVHGETSTGVAQPLDGLAEACRERDALLLIDCVTSLAGHPLDLDAAGVDAAFSGTQKCLNCPPGLAPFTLNDRAARARRRLAAPGTSTSTLILGYWEPSGGDGAPQRAYHHTAPINLVYALHEALELVCEEGARGPLGASPDRPRGAARGARRARASKRLAPAGEELYPLLCGARSARTSTRLPCAVPCSSATASRSPAASGR